MRSAAARAVFGEVRDVAQAVRHEQTTAPVGPVVVSGMLADQLVKELGANAEPGAVLVGDASTRACEVVVRIVAGDPTPEDEAVVRDADRRGIGVVLVQVWPQAAWTRPFVLTPFVVECSAGMGFPVGEIGDRIADASEHATALASRIPALRPSVEKAVVTRAVVRAGLLGALPGSGVRRVLTLEQIRMVTRLRSIERGQVGDGAAGFASFGQAVGLVLATGVGLRGVAHAARQVLPAPVANGLVAAAGTWAIARTARSASRLRVS